MIIDDDIVESYEVFQLTASVAGSGNATLSVVIEDYGDRKP